MNDDELKKKFADELLKNPGDPFPIALALFPDNTNRALRVATEWPQDIVVLEYIANVKKEKREEDYLPTKADLCRKIWDKLDKPFVYSEDFVKLAKLYADIMGYIEKPQTNIKVDNTTVNNKVMVVKTCESDNEWEQRALRQQEKLINADSIN